MTKTAILQGCIERIAPHVPAASDMRIEYRHGKRGFWLCKDNQTIAHISDYKRGLAFLARLAIDKRPTYAMLRG